VPDLYRLSARDNPFAGCGVPPRERGGEGDPLIDTGGGGGGGEGERGGKSR